MYMKNSSTFSHVILHVYSFYRIILHMHFINFTIDVAYFVNKYKDARKNDIRKGKYKKLKI